MEDMFYDDEGSNLVSRNYLLFMDDRLSSAAKSSGAGDYETSSKNAAREVDADAAALNEKLKPTDKLIIKAKVYILEILEVEAALFSRGGGRETLKILRPCTFINLKRRFTTTTKTTVDKSVVNIIPFLLGLIQITQLILHYMLKYNFLI